MGLPEQKTKNDWAHLFRWASRVNCHLYGQWPGLEGNKIGISQSFFNYTSAIKWATDFCWGLSAFTRTFKPPFWHSKCKASSRYKDQIKWKFAGLHQQCKFSTIYVLVFLVHLKSLHIIIGYLQDNVKILEYMKSHAIMIDLCCGK